LLEHGGQVLSDMMVPHHEQRGPCFSSYALRPLFIAEKRGNQQQSDAVETFLKNRRNKSSPLLSITKKGYTLCLWLKGKHASSYLCRTSAVIWPCGSIGSAGQTNR
jgi:hypothetical protein